MKPSNSKRRFLPRYSVRTLLVLMTAVCLWLGFWVHSANVQKRAVRAIVEAGGTVLYENEFDERGFRKQESEIDPPGWIERNLGCQI